MNTDVKHRQAADTSLTMAILQITLINLVFSVDSILTALSMNIGLPYASMVMGIAIVVSVLILLLAPIGKFCHSTFLSTSFGTLLSFVDWFYTHL